MLVSDMYMCLCAYVLMGHLARLEITLGKWLMLGAYIRAPPLPGVVPALEHLKPSHYSLPGNYIPIALYYLVS
jgi:hypothetical protein